MIRTIAKVAVVAVVAGVPSLGALAPANAQVVGRRCAVTTKGATVITGGPLVADVAGATISMTCTLQIGTANSTHAGADAAVVASDPSTQVAVIPPTVVNVSTGDEAAYVCTAATVNGTAYYLDAVAGTWSTSDTVPCGLSLDTRRTLTELDEVFADANSVLLLFDPLVCGVLVQLAPGVPGVVDIHPDGDVYVAGEFIYDCPPYGS